MAIEFKNISDIVIEVNHRGIPIASIYKWKAGRRPQIALHDLTDIEVVEQILIKMKELQGEKV